MRIISRKTLIDFWEKYPECKQSLKAWFDEARNATWSSPNDLKTQYRNASIINNRRVVFNINGNKFRLITDIEYRIGIIFVVWIGTHRQYDKINVAEINYVKANKK